MIFSLADHIEQIKTGIKTKTRRQSGTYLKGRSYSIQPKRGELGILEGRILITNKRLELRAGISPEDARAEGKYSPKEFEELYSKMYPGWPKRYAYTFRYLKQEKMHQHTCFVVN